MDVDREEQHCSMSSYVGINKEGKDPTICKRVSQCISIQRTENGTNWNGGGPTLQPLRWRKEALYVKIMLILPVQTGGEVDQREASKHGGHGMERLHCGAPVQLQGASTQGAATCTRSARARRQALVVTKDRGTSKLYPHTRQEQQLSRPMAPYNTGPEGGQESLK